SRLTWKSNAGFAITPCCLVTRPIPGRSRSPGCGTTPALQTTRSQSLREGSPRRVRELRLRRIVEEWPRIIFRAALCWFISAPCRMRPFVQPPYDPPESTDAADDYVPGLRLGVAGVCPAHLRAGCPGDLLHHLRNQVRRRTRAPDLLDHGRPGGDAQ